MLLKITSIKNAAALLDKKQNKISIEQFKFFVNRLPVCTENYQNIIKIAYYNSKLDWLDFLLNKYKKEEPQSIENNIELTLQFILWGGVEAYQILKKNYIFYDTKLVLNMKIIKKLFIMYAYEEKYMELREILQDLLIYDKTLMEKLKCLKLNSDYMIILNRLDLDLTLVTKSKKERKIKV